MRSNRRSRNSGRFRSFRNKTIFTLFIILSSAISFALTGTVFIAVTFTGSATPLEQEGAP